MSEPYLEVVDAEALQKRVRELGEMIAADYEGRNFARAVAAGSAAHSDHGRDLAFTLKAVAKGEAQGYKIRDPFKLKKLAQELKIERP